MWAHHIKKGRGVAEIKIREDEEVKEDGVRNYLETLLRSTLSFMVEPGQLVYEHRRF